MTCCPGLQSLKADTVAGHLGRLTPLRRVLQLSLLTALTVISISDTEAQEVAVRLPRLRRLEVGLGFAAHGCITAAGISQLSGLQLTFLSLKGFRALSLQDQEKKAAYEAYTPYRVLDSTLASVALLTSLQELQLRNHVHFRDAGLLQLSALRQLTQLVVQDAPGLLGFDDNQDIWVLPTEVSKGTAYGEG